MEEKGRAIFLDKGERSWKERFACPAHVEEHALYFIVFKQPASRGFFRTLPESVGMEV